MKGAEFLVGALEREGVDVVFGYPGGAIMPVYDALYGSALRHVLVRHEQAAVLAADGYARATGRVGVCLATSGPGATNLVTGLANAFLDSVPIVAVTGQVPTALMGTDAFQEVDIFGMTLSVVKHSFVVRHPKDLPEVLREAFRLARSGRPGPVLVDLPKDVASAESVFEPSTPTPVTAPAALASPESLHTAHRLMEASERPVVYAGGGVVLGGAVESFRRFVETTRLPVVTTLKGIGVLPSDHELLLGMLGMHGSRAANLAVQNSDLLVAVGVRFDDRATGKLEKFAPGANVIHLDIDAAEVGKLRRPEVGIVGELTPSLAALSTPLAIDRWREECLSRKLESAFDYDRPGEGVFPPRLLRALCSRARGRARDFVVTCDVGQHQMWVAQHGSFCRPEEHLSSGGLGTMGYGLPAAIGAQLGRPEATVVNVSGDGSFMMNLQELATVRRYRLPIKIVLLDNQSLGLVRQWQELFFEERYSEIDLSDNPDFVRVAESFGIPGFVLESAKGEEETIDRLLASPGPALLHVRVDRRANVWPLVPPNRGNEEMLDERAPVVSRKT